MDFAACHAAYPFEREGGALAFRYPLFLPVWATAVNKACTDLAEIIMIVPSFAMAGLFQLCDT